jgi:hypothetical protein
VVVRDDLAGTYCCTYVYVDITCVLGTCEERSVVDMYNKRGLTTTD